MGRAELLPMASKDFRHIWMINSTQINISARSGSDTPENKTGDLQPLITATT